MPYVEIISAAGPAKLFYTISTPTANNADSIDAKLPTIIFLHPVYVAQAVFHYQFADPIIRRFNLIALDLRFHGHTEGSVPLVYRSKHAAEDVYQFMGALDLPPCHFFGVSMGSSVALQLSINHPEKVLSLFLVSPLPLTETDLVLSGRQEIYDCWAEGASNGSVETDDLAIRDAIFGALDFGFNRNTSSIVNALVNYTLPQAIKLWLPERLEELHTASVAFFANGQPLTTSELTVAKCPVHLIHCDADLAYPLQGAEDIRAKLVQAGRTVRLTQVPNAPHFGHVIYPDIFNALLNSWMEEHATPVAVLASEVTSPFEGDLIQCGLTQGGSDSEDELYLLI